MDRRTRNAIERATQRARALLEADFGAQLEGRYDMLPGGSITLRPPVDLPADEVATHAVITAAIERKVTSGMDRADAMRDYLRDAAFTTLNRFVALKMLEARSLVQQCVSRGEQSSGYAEFTGMAPGLTLLPDGGGYRLYLESLFDELSTEVKVLFDRRDPASALWPRRAALEQLLEVLNAADLDHVWGEDETIGWVYQYFNSDAERKEMRKASQAPRNSREVAVRNQFFTPRYVVRFLTDNTLGRTWLEMHGETTRLAETCEYLVRQVGQPIGSRPRKDPRDLRVLDPACGSGHFLLYAFDLLLTVYEESWAVEDASAPRSELTGHTLRQDYPDLAALHRAAPGLIVEHNLHGVDIDARCAQITALALWLRAQRAYQEQGIPAGARPRIVRTHIVVAEPMPGNLDLAKAFAAELDKPFQRILFARMIEEMRLAGELGPLLQVERSLVDDISRARQQFLAQEQTVLPGFDSAYEQERLDLSGVTDETVFHDAEESILAALRRFAESASGRDARRRLFAGDAAQGVALIDLLRKQFDVILMNPPFGLMPRAAYTYLVSNYPNAYYDFAVAFMARALRSLTRDGLCGAITTRSFMSVTDAAAFRRDIALPSIEILADLGSGVMDGAAVDASAQVLSHAAHGDLAIVNLRKVPNKAEALRVSTTSEGDIRLFARNAFDGLPERRLAYDAVLSLSHLFSDGPGGVEPNAAIARIGARTFDDERFLRCRWEVEPGKLGHRWLPLSRSAEDFSLYYYPPLLTVNWSSNGREVCARNEQVNGQTAQARQGSTHYGKSGLVFARRSSPSIAFRAHPAGAAFASNTGVVLPHDGVDPLLLLAFLNSSPVRAATNALANRDSYTVGHIKKIRWPRLDAAERNILAQAALEILAAKHWLYRLEETDPWFSCRESLCARSNSHDAFVSWRSTAMSVKDRLLARYELIDAVVMRVLDVQEVEELQSQFRVAQNDVLKPTEQFQLDWSTWVVRCLCFALGVALGRWTEVESLPTLQPDAALGSLPESTVRYLQTGVLASVLVDDPGHHRDIVAVLEDAWHALWPSDRDTPGPHPMATLGENIRDWIGTQLFDWHLRLYSRAKRAAPIYWQIGVPSGRYSVWLHAHALTRDSMFAIQNDVVAPKLTHEERRLSSLRAQARSTPTARERDEIADQESLVEELRMVLDEVRRIAPLWNPDLDDGIVLVMAPLWRLVPIHRAWQRELQSKWDELAAGKYDWAHIAMHLWPERVVPKCAIDRSLAIAHGLENVFWVEGDDGKWTRRPSPTRPVEELVAERTSPAVKAALASLLNAPEPAGGARKGRRKVGVTA